MQKEIKVQQGQTIFDIAYLCYNDSNLVYRLIEENPIIDNINSNIIGLTLVYTPVDFVKVVAKLNENKVNKIVTIKQNQSLFDLSLQYYGNLESVYDLIKSNNIDSIIATNYYDKTIKDVTERNYVNNYFSKYSKEIGTYQRAETVVETGFVIDEVGNIIWDGVDELIY